MEDFEKREKTRSNNKMSAHDKLSSLDKISISELSRKKQVEFVDYNLTKDIINLLKQSY